MAFCKNKQECHSIELKFNSPFLNPRDKFFTAVLFIYYFLNVANCEIVPNSILAILKII